MGYVSMIMREDVWESVVQHVQVRPSRVVFPIRALQCTAFAVQGPKYLTKSSSGVRASELPLHVEAIPTTVHPSNAYVTAGRVEYFLQYHQDQGEKQAANCAVERQYRLLGWCVAAVDALLEDLVRSGKGWSVEVHHWSRWRA